VEVLFSDLTMGQANSLPENHAHRYPAIAEEAAAAHKRSQALWRDKLRKPDGKELAPETYRELKLHEICTSDALLSQLAALGVGASTPACVYADKVPKEKARAAKNGRFFFYAGRPGRHIAEIFTDDELDSLVEDGDKLRAREMPVFDREGRRYGFEFMYYDRDFYQLAGPGGEFDRFMVDNSVARDVVELGKKMTMQIFAFRSPKLLLAEGEGFQNHPDGALGMIILFSESEEEDEYAELIELDDDSMTVKEMIEHLGQNQQNKHL
jgi:hypothetical protein